MRWLNFQGICEVKICGNACRCLAQEVWLQPLAGRFLRLVLQMLSRFCSWLSGGLEARAAAAPQPVAADGEANPPASKWAIGIRPDQLCSLRGDTERLMSWLGSKYSSQLMLMLPSSTKEVRVLCLLDLCPASPQPGCSMGRCCSLCMLQQQAFT